MTEKHEPTAECAGAHCYVHHGDEFAPRSYIGCLECGHLFRTRRSLWWGNLRTVWQFRRFEPLAVWVPMTLRWALTPPSRIYTCPECTHDL